MNGVPKVLAMLWESHTPILKRIEKDLDVEMDVLTAGMAQRDGLSTSDVVERMRRADITLIYKQGTKFHDDLDRALHPIKSQMKIICFGNDATMWNLTSVDHEVAVKCFEYMMKSGDENLRRMFKYACYALLGTGDAPPPPLEVPWQGIAGTSGADVYQSLDEYISAEGLDPSEPFVGILASRPAYLMDNLVVERQLAADLQRLGVNPVLSFVAFSKKPEMGRISHGECIKRYFCEGEKPRVDAIVKFSTGFLCDSKYDAAPGEVDAMELLRTMNVPVYQPVVMARMSEDEWRSSITLTSDIAWQIAFPEFEGIVEPIVVGSDVGHVRTDEKARTPFPERTNRLAERIVNTIALRRKPNSEKRVVIFLNNFPCYGVEANVGNAAGLDSLESIADVMKAMQARGYSVDPPKDGKDLISRILESKALSEFRWTTAQEMLRHGGVIHEMDLDEYLSYFSTLTEEARNDVIRVWGEPPGKGMVFDGKILITGVEFGNVAVAVQPKRGCYGAKCDGQVCKILHDPTCPPTHQYLATYHYYERIWRADAVIHTGTHGSMEWTPGKGVGLTESSYPDLCIGSAPHFYIYNSDNPSEGLVAKRRSYATLVDHMQHLMVDVELYGPYKELDLLLGEYAVARNDPTSADRLKNSILAKVSETDMTDIGLTEESPLEECVRRCHEELSKLRNSQMNKGLHILGRMPEGEDRVDTIYSIVRYGEEHDSLRDCISELMGFDLSELYSDQGAISVDGRSNGAVIEEIGQCARTFVGNVLNGHGIEESLSCSNLKATEEQASKFEKFFDTILDIDSRIEESDEIGSLLNCLDGGRTQPGPSGYITRGRYDILPTGRNFYSMDPHSVPSRTAWAVGRQLAEETISKFVEKEGRVPECIGFFWTMGELISTGGELMSEMMHLMGAEPVWEPDGRVKKFRIVPLEELGRPRVDVTINISCILRDNMTCAIDFMDEVVNAIVNQEEPADMNYVRKHSLESLKKGASEESANTRMFGAPPGTYTSGVNLAVFASAWKEDGDLANVFVKTKGHGYGGKRQGEPMYEQFATALARTEIACGGTSSDETDVLSCSCQFSNIGGMISATRYLSGKDVKAYYADTRDPRDLNITTFAEELRRVMRTKTLNPKWIEGMQEHGYKGANDISKRVVRVLGWQATTHEVDDWMFDRMAELLVLDEANHQFFEENNPYALEEMTRRLLEAEARGLWNANPDILARIKESYLRTEALMEERAGEGEYQGGSIDVYDSKSVPDWDAEAKSVASMTMRIREAHGRETTE